MAVALRQLASNGWRPKETLIYFGVAGEEAGGTHGAKWMADNHWGAVGADYVPTEIGGLPLGSSSPRRVWINVAEKGTPWRRRRVTGTRGHGSMPFGSDNAEVKAAEVIRRLSSYRPQRSVSGSDPWSRLLAITIHVGIRPFPPSDLQFLSPPSLSCSDVSITSMLGGWTPPSVSAANSLVTGVPGSAGGSCRPTTGSKSPGRYPFSCAVELGGIEPPSISR
jgi:acetylornithine deacetylase/succinyl-diaminopimelate desuccinylase-like protein